LQQRQVGMPTCAPQFQNEQQEHFDDYYQFQNATLSKTTIRNAHLQLASTSGLGIRQNINFRGGIPLNINYYLLRRTQT
jgi:hypothetical protein